MMVLGLGASLIVASTMVALTLLLDIEGARATAAECCF